jgi:hypothetical protein
LNAPLASITLGFHRTQQAKKSVRRCPVFEHDPLMVNLIFRQVERSTFGAIETSALEANPFDHFSGFASVATSLILAHPTSSPS